VAPRQGNPVDTASQSHRGGAGVGSAKTTERKIVASNHQSKEGVLAPARGEEELLRKTKTERRAQTQYSNPREGGKGQQEMEKNCFKEIVDIACSRKKRGRRFFTREKGVFKTVHPGLVGKAGLRGTKKCQTAQESVEKMK